MENHGGEGISWEADQTGQSNDGRCAKLRRGENLSELSGSRDTFLTEFGQLVCFVDDMTACEIATMTELYT